MPPGLQHFLNAEEIKRGGVVMRPAVAALSQVAYDRPVMDWCSFLLEEHNFVYLFFDGPVMDWCSFFWRSIASAVYLFLKTMSEDCLQDTPTVNVLGESEETL